MFDIHCDLSDFCDLYKGYVNIVRSSVLEMVFANRQNEYVKQNNVVFILKSILGIVLLGVGFILRKRCRIRSSREYSNCNSYGYCWNLICCLVDLFHLFFKH